MHPTKTVMRQCALFLLAGLLAAACAGPSRSGPASPLPMAERTWQDEVIYFIMTDRFANGDPGNDGDSDPANPGYYHGGDFQGIIDRLDSVRDLGATAIWITPVVSNTRGGYHGYWALDLNRINPYFGDMGRLKALVAAAHQREMRVILDVVLNHVGYDHPWLTDPGRAGWFHAPCEINYSQQKSVEECWLAGLPDLNTENPAVRRMLTDYTLGLIRETGADGFRVDTAKHMPRELLRDWSREVRQEFPRFWLLGEVWSTNYVFQNEYLESGLDAVTDFTTYEAVRAALADPGEPLSPLLRPPPAAEKRLVRPADRVTFVDNHDVDRLVGRNPGPGQVQRLRLALAYLLTAPGIPTIYYGTEVGLGGVQANHDNRRDMPWDAPPHPELRDYVKRLTGLRHELSVLRRGGFVEVKQAATTVVYARVLDREAALVVLNGADEPWAGQVSLQQLPWAEGTQLVDRLAADSRSAPRLRVGQQSVSLEVPPGTAQVWVPIR